MGELRIAEKIKQDIESLIKKAKRPSSQYSAFCWKGILIEQNPDYSEMTQEEIKEVEWAINDFLETVEK